MTWAASFFYSVVAMLAAAMANRVLERRDEWRKNAVIAAYRAESIEANKELERLRQEVRELTAKLDAAEGKQIAAEEKLRRIARLN